MFPAPAFWRSDAAHPVQRHYASWREVLTKAPREAGKLDVEGSAHAMRLEAPDEAQEVAMARRLRTVTLDFVVNVSGDFVLKRLKGHKPGESAPLLSAAIDGASLVKHLTSLAHELPEHETRFRTAFLVAIHLRESSVSGVAKTAGACSAQVLFKDCAFRRDRCKIASLTPDQASETRWTAYLRSQALGVQRYERKECVHSYALRMAPGCTERYPPGHVLLYHATTGLDTRLLQHIDAGSLGLCNFLVHHDGGTFVRCPKENPADNSLVCPDSLSWFIARAWGQMYTEVAFFKKIRAPKTVLTRRDELDRYRQALARGQTFVPRSHLREFQTEMRDEHETGISKDNAVVSLVPVTPEEIKTATDLFHKQVVRANRGFVDFSQGVTAVFEPFDCDAWAKHVKSGDEISVTLSVDLLYVPLLSWLDTAVASAIPSQGFGEEEESKMEEEEEDAITFKDVRGEEECVEQEEADEALLEPPSASQKQA